MIEVSVYHLMAVRQHCRCQNSNVRLLLLSTDLIHFDGYEELQVPLMAFWRISAAAVMSNPPVADACQDPHPVFRFQSKFRSCNSQCHYKRTCALLRTDRDTRTYKADVIGSCFLLQRWKITEAYRIALPPSAKAGIFRDLVYDSPIVLQEQGYQKYSHRSPCRRKSPEEFCASM